MNRWHKVALIVIVIALLSPVAVVEILYGDQMEFISYQFAGDYLKFIGSLVSISFSFYLVNIFWKNKENNDAINHAKSMFINFTFRASNIADKSLELLNKSFNESEYSESQKRDNEVARLIEKMHKVGLAIENTPVDSRALKDDVFMSVYIDLVWRDLFSAVERLSLLKNFRNNYDDFLSALVEIKTIAKKILQ
ncbi:MAG: hypothetical protein IPP66_16770 [Anaerolineales bacterium]|nr:hypothetical protein [Anaerolineales bacterium]